MRSSRLDYRPLRPGELVHKRTQLVGIHICGAKARDGARCASLDRRVTCETCRTITRTLRLAAKARMARELGL